MTLADWHDDFRCALTRRGLVVGSFVLGIALAAAMRPVPTLFAAGQRRLTRN